MKSTMGYLTNAENADVHYMYDRENVFQRLHHHLPKTRSFLVTGHNAGLRRAVSSSSLEESILNVVADRPESSTRAVAHHVSGSYQTVCRVLKENRFHPFHFQRVQALNSVDYLLRLPVGGTTHVLNNYEHYTCQGRFQ
ncbi:hypothetical protein TNCV_1276131 [Trichonephila clavipes]|nr:hypothetical protein TNCV_1276131 [Trichonephila clavipes]